MESIAAGFADPEWVPQKITCIAWSWVGSDEIRVETCGGSAGLYEKPWLRRYLLETFLRDYAEATMVTGHNILRHDLPLLDAECKRLGLPVPGPVRAQDTIRFRTRSKGFKKGQDNLGGLLKTLEQKKQMDWQQWEDAYAEDGWAEVKDRARSDVAMHKEIREKMLANDWLRRPVMWP